MKWTPFLILLAGCVSDPPPTQSPPTGLTVVTNAPVPLLAPMPLAKPQKPPQTYTLTLGWNQMPPFQGQVLNYQLGWAQDTNYASLSRPSTNTSFRVVNLNYGIVYYFAVRSVATNDNYSLWSAPIRYSQKQSGNGSGPAPIP